MTNRESILRRAIEKAVGNGWTVYRSHELPHISTENLAFDIVKHPGQERVLIFSHDFAKKFWGELPHYIEGTYENRECTECDAQDPKTNFCWQYHLQIMVLAEDPLKYLEQFLEEDENQLVGRVG